MKDEITIKITLERLTTELDKINNLVVELTKNLGKIEGIKVLDYSQIKSQLILNKEEVIKK